MSTAIAHERTLCDCFDEVAARHELRTALHTSEGVMTYAELAAQADRIAAFIRDRVGDVQHNVAILFDRAAPAIPAILGILKAGHAYIPLDPSDPPARLKLVIEDSGAVAILTDSRTKSVAMSLANSQCDIINTDEIDGHTGPVATPPLSGDARACIFYTSGSTGRPKGVIQTHRSIRHFAGSYAEQLGITSDDRLSLLYSLSFSASSMDIYGALLNGATLCPCDVRRTGVERLATWIQEHRITVLHAVPTLLRHLVKHRTPGLRMSTVRVIDLGGEPVFGSDARLCYESFSPNCVLINHYAATEASVIAQHPVQNNPLVDGLLPAGRQARGADIQIERDDGSEAQAGEPGQIVVRSRFLSPGYWRRDDLTRAAFGGSLDEDGVRTYRTGDRGRIDADGLLHVLGRVDSRVKIRGHTVDVTEVEVVLRGLPGVTEAAVIATGEDDDQSSERRLIAFAVVDSTTSAELRRLIKQRLPRYMVPAVVQTLTALPLTATGKVDRTALAQLPFDAPTSAAFFEPPETQLERTVAAVFEKVLAMRPVGRLDDFFDLGGDSLRLVQLQLELRIALGTDAELSDVLEDASVAGIAKSIKRKRRRGFNHHPLSPLIIPLREAGPKAPMFLVHGLNGQAFVGPAFVEAVGDDRPIYAFQARGLVGSDRPHCRIRAMAADYIAAMRMIAPSGPYMIAGMCSGSVIAHEMACQLSDAGQAVSLLLMIDPTPPVPWRGRLRRVRDVLFLHLARSPRRTRAGRNVRRDIEKRLRRRSEEGRAPAGRLDQRARDAAIRVAIDFRLAMLWHRPRTYGGSAHVIGSRNQLEDVAWNRTRWPEFVAGEVRRFEVGSDHEEVLNPGNGDFVRAMRECLAHAESWA